MGVEVEEDGLEVEWVASAEAVGERGEGEAVAEKVILYLSIVEGREQIENGVDLLHSVGDDIAREGNDPDGCAKEAKALSGRPRDPAIKRVHFRWGLLTAPDERFGGVEDETHWRPKGLEKVKGAD